MIFDELLFFFPQIAKFDTSIKLFCLILLTPQFLLEVFFLQLTQ